MQFQWTITFGDVMWILASVGSAAIILQKVLNRLDSLELWREEHRACNYKQIEILNELREVVSFVRGQMDRR